jgi:RNA polymerase sigma-70 factor, ECF subfamily
MARALRPQRTGNKEQSASGGRFSFKIAVLPGVSEPCGGRWQMAQLIDRHEVDRLVVEHLPAALRLALRLSGDGHAAEDVVQEALCRVLRRWRSFRGDASFRTWLLQIVVNVNRDRLRRVHAYQPICDCEPLATTPKSEELAAGTELHGRICAAIEFLPERQREVALLTWGEGLAAGEVAQVLEITEANVNTTLHLARKRIAQAIGVDYAKRNET